MTPLRPALGLLALALAPFLVAPAGAAVGDTHRPSALPWADVVQVDRFDPSQGELGAVLLSIDTFARADLRAENVGDAPQMVSAHALATVSVRLPNGVEIAAVPFEGDAHWTLGAYDGAVDYAGTSGRRATPSGRRTVEVLIDDPSLVLYFLGLPGASGVVELPVAAVGATSIVGGRPLLASATLDAGVRVRATYLLVTDA